MPQIYLRAEAGDYAPLVLLPGDPGRATMIAGLFDGGLDKARLVNPASLAARLYGHVQGQAGQRPDEGMGTPSFSIVMEELLMLGVKRFIRTGTCGGIGRGLQDRRSRRCHGRRCPLTARRGRISTATLSLRPRISS